MESVQNILRDYNYGEKPDFLFFWGHQPSKTGEITKLYPAGDFCGWCGNQDVCEQNNLKECNPEYMDKD